MNTAVNQTEEKNKRIGLITSIVTHTLLFLLALMAIIHFPDPPPGQEGILVNLGIPDVGQGNENMAAAKSKKTTQPKDAQPKEKATPQKKEKKPKRTQPKAKPKKEVVKTEDPAAIALKKKKEAEAKKKWEERRQKEKAEADRKKRQEAERKRQAEAARKKAEEEQKFNEAKKKYGDLFGGGKGSGKGNTGKAGNQGDPGGDPDASKLEGISTGTGRVGGGLGNRGLVKSPNVRDNSQKTGVVVLRVCVNSDGRVVEVKYTQSGSTTTDSRLKSLAIANAKKWRFAKSSIDKQCGTIKYDFKVR